MKSNIGLMNHLSKFDRYIKGVSYRLVAEGLSGAVIKDYGDYVLKIQNKTKESIQEIHNFKKYQDILPIPSLIDYEISEDQTTILMTKMKGVSLSSAVTKIDPFQLIDVLVQGIKILWEKSTSVSLESSLNKKLEKALSNIENQRVDIIDMEKNFRKEFKTPEKMYQYLIDHKPKEELVLSHGDFCLPNIFIDNNKLSGFVDLADIDVMDQYQDIALCYRSLMHNYREQLPQNHSMNMIFKYFFDQLGINPDFKKIKYYLLLDELF